ncbi:Glycosyl transferase family protein [Paraburkholderia ribeironis]|uniref:Glycosyl transferase family protein n=2 Tax=Paraburkholderia ribeironis TaxID=1247936 RepID=A0A1N7SGW9_9BURK|nr:Glycosyl transferase family protein [Paraburkholderia ribeironis]
MTALSDLPDCLNLELIRVPLAAHTDLLGSHKLWLEDVYERLAGPLPNKAMTTTNTKVSICLPTCNRPHLIAQCIDSCLMQTHTNIEIVIGDDSKDDHTQRLIASRYGHEKRIRYQRNMPPLGQARNVASLFARAIGARILLMHDDDYLVRNGVARLLEQWSVHSDLEVAFGNQYEVDQHGRVAPDASRRLNADFHRTPVAAGIQEPPGRVGLIQMFPNNGWLANAELVKRIGYKEQYGTCCDFVFGTELCLAARRVCYLNEYVSYYRKTDVSISQTTRGTTSAATLTAWHFVKSLELPPALEPARKLALRRLVPIVVSLHAQNREPRAGLRLALSHLYAYNFGFNPRLYFHLWMILKAMWRLL